MKRGLYLKLVLIMLLLIISLMMVVGAFLARGLRDFYMNQFYDQMTEAFSNTGLISSIRSAAREGSGTDAAVNIAERLGVYAGLLGVDASGRNYYILDGETGDFLSGTDMRGGAELPLTPNILTALGGEIGAKQSGSADYMDFAVPVKGGSGSYIVVIRDNKQTVRSLTGALLRIILISLLVGLVISALLSLLLAKGVVTPIQSLTRASEKVAGGDFTSRPKNNSSDEIGILTRTFNNMADRLQETMSDLQRSEAMRREFVANVSHELRTPITSIRSYAETLTDSEGMSRDMENHFLEVIVGESDRMTKIVEDLLTLSRFDAARGGDFKFERFSFEKSVRGVFDSMLIEAKRRGHEYLIELDYNMPAICGDRARIEQVIINMLSNAIKYTPDGGRVELAAGSTGDTVWLSVTDSGIGIPENDLNRVFERFYRIDKARSRESGGTGLGLSIAKEIVNRHEGTIELESKPGAGTLITITLPVEGPHSE